MTEESMIWTGEMTPEFKAFCLRSAFGCLVGSNYHRWRWYHRAWNLLTRLRPNWCWHPKDDPFILEIVNCTPEEPGPNWWTTASPGDRVWASGRVTR